MADFPTIKSPHKAELHSIQPSRVSTSHTLRRVVRYTGAQRWGFKFTIRNMTRAQRGVYQAFMNSLKGQSVNCNVKLWGYQSPLGIYSSGSDTPVVSGAHSLGDETIDTTGWRLSGTGLLLAGDLIKFANHAKIYQVVADVDSDGSGNATISIIPGLVSTLVDTEALSIGNLKLQAQSLMDIHKYPEESVGLTDMDFEFIEVVT